MGMVVSLWMGDVSEGVSLGLRREEGFEGEVFLGFKRVEVSGEEGFFG